MKSLRDILWSYIKTAAVSLVFATLVLSIFSALYALFSRFKWSWPITIGIVLVLLLYALFKYRNSLLEIMSSKEKLIDSAKSAFFFLVLAVIAIPLFVVLWLDLSWDRHELDET